MSKKTSNSEAMYNGTHPDIRGMSGSAKWDEQQDSWLFLPEKVSDAKAVDKENWYRVHKKNLIFAEDLTTDF